MMKTFWTTLLIALLLAFGGLAQAQEQTPEPTAESTAAVVITEEAAPAAAPEAVASPAATLPTEDAAPPTDNTGIILAIVVSGIVAAVGAYVGLSRSSKS